MQMAWMRHLTKIASGFSKNEEPQESFDCCSIAHALGKYVFVYMSKEKNYKRSPPRVLNTVKEQSDSGLMLLAGGCLGQMFRLTPFIYYSIANEKFNNYHNFTNRQYHLTYISILNLQI